MASAFAELMAAEAEVRADMRKKLDASKPASNPLAAFNSAKPTMASAKPSSAKTAASTEQQLRALGLGASPALAMTP
eukprot:7376904-Prymnesium_polylepis.1